jgi:DNA polymerase III subunit beta
MIIITQKNLFNALSLVESTVHKIGVSEYSQAVLIQHFGEHLKFQTTNLHASTEAICQDFQGNLENDVCVDFQDLFEIIKRYTAEEELTLAVKVVNDAKFLTLSKGTRSFAELPTHNPEYFPKFLNIENEDCEFRFNKEVLRTAIEKTHFCIYPNETRYNINGLHFKFQSQNKKIDVASTDGHRFAKFEIEDTTLKSDAKITIPRSIVLGIKKDIHNAHSEIIFKIKGGKLQIDFGSHTLTAKLIDADFPNYNRVIPTDHDVIIDGVVKPKVYDAVIKINKPSFSQSLDRVQSIIQKNSTPQVVINFQNKELEMSCNDNQKKTKEILDCEFEGEHLLMANAMYMKECIQGISSREFEISVKRGDSNIPIKIQDAEDKRFFYIVMPMKN